MNDSYIGKRFEFKYFLDPALAQEIESYIQKLGVVVSDKYSQKGPYIVNSLYFDTPFLDDYRDKDGSFLVRRKLRARMYKNSWFEEIDSVFLEIKKKYNMNISKTRLKISGKAWNDFIKDGEIFKLNKFVSSDEDIEGLRRFAYIYSRYSYNPYVVVRYDRIAYLANFLSLVRITFDKNIQTCFARDNLAEKFMISVARDRVIMEVKYNGKVPWWFTEIITRFNLERTDFSKYRNSVAVLRGHYQIPVYK